MKRFTFLPPLIGALSLAALIGSAAFAQSFEGVVQMTVKGENGENAITYMMKDDVVRMEFEGGRRGPMVMLRNNKEDKTIVLMSEMKSYMEMTMPQVPKDKEGAPVKGKVTKTGKTEKILGYDCDQFIVKNEDKETEVWAAKGIGKFMRMSGPRQQNVYRWENESEFKDYFPLRVVSRATEDEKESSMEVTKIEKKSLNAALFKIPEDFKKMEMPSFGRPQRQ
ncbi:MAG: DUF4412 domain-containing protein [Bacteroidota bacterium]